MKKRAIFLLMMTVLLMGCGKKEVSSTNVNTQTKQESEMLEVGTENVTEETTQTEMAQETEAIQETEATQETEVTSELESEVAEPESEVEVHVHSYSEEVTSVATCTQEGEKKFTCACGEAYTESIDRSSHSYGEYNYNNDATQSADGTKSRSCSACGTVDTVVAEGTKLPFDPYSLRAISSLDEIASVGTMTQSDDSIYNEVRSNIEAGAYEKVRFVASNGDQFCMWNVRLTDERSKDDYGITSYYWFMAPIEGKFSDGYKYCNFTGGDAQSTEKYMILRGRNISGSVHESMLNPPTKLPAAYREMNTEECPVDLYEIVETENMISVWVESTNCGQEGIGTCGDFNCKQTCLRYTTLQEFDTIPREKGWMNTLWGENGRINWNGKLLVNFYYLKCD